MLGQILVLQNILTLWLRLYDLGHLVPLDEINLAALELVQLLQVLNTLDLPDLHLFSLHCIVL